MAKGSKDWVSQFNLTLQELSQLVVRTKYGACQIAKMDWVMAEGWSWILDVTGAGVIYGGWFDYVNSGVQMRVTLDGGDPLTFTFSKANPGVLDEPLLPFFRSMIYDPTGGLFRCGLGLGVTFESRFYLEVYAPAASIWLHGEAFYALI